MEYRRLGTSGTKVSAISIGAWLTYGSNRIDFETTRDILTEAIDSGINFIDVANIYAYGRAEETVGRVIKPYDRTRLVISTKVFFPMSDDVNHRGLSRKHITESVHQSLQRLGTDYVDVLFCHRYDSETRTDETVRAIEDLIRQGKVLYWGTSMWTADQIEEGITAADQHHAYRPVVEQPLYNMLDRHVVEGDLETTLNAHGIGLTIWSPLAGGLLTGKYNEGVPDDSRASRVKADWIQEGFSPHRVEQARQISAIAADLNVAPSALALAWALRHPNVDSVIIGATKPQHLRENLKALEIDLTAEDEQRIEDALQNKPHNSQRVIVHPDEIPSL